MKRIISLIALFSTCFLISGCVTQGPAPDPSILRVGISANAQPIAFKQGGQIVGIEADFAKRIGAALNREIVFVEVPWDKQIDYLEQNKTDIIMSGMTVTGARSIRVNFTKPYMQSGLTTLFRRDAYEPTSLLASTIMNQNKRVGFVKNSTGEYFVMQHFARSEKCPYPNSTAATDALTAGKIDMFIHDAPIIWWLSAVNESKTVAFPDLLNIEPLAWGVSKSNMKLLEEVNLLVDQWSNDGSSIKTITNWLPKLR